MKIKKKILQRNKIGLVLWLWFLLFPGMIRAISAPIYKGMKNWGIEKVGLNEIVLRNTIVMFNPNSIGCVHVKKIFFDVYIDKNKLGTITQADGDVAIKKQAEFYIPLRISIQLKGDVLSRLSSLLGFFTDKVRVSYSGYVKIRAFLFFGYKAEINDGYDVRIKDLI